MKNHCTKHSSKAGNLIRGVSFARCGFFYLKQSESCKLISTFQEKVSSYSSYIILAYILKIFHNYNFFSSIAAAIWHALFCIVIEIHPICASSTDTGRWTAWSTWGSLSALKALVASGVVESSRAGLQRHTTIGSLEKDGVVWASAFVVSTEYEWWQAGIASSDSW